VLRRFVESVVFGGFHHGDLCYRSRFRINIHPEQTGTSVFPVPFLIRIFRWDGFGHIFVPWRPPIAKLALAELLSGIVYRTPLVAPEFPVVLAPLAENRDTQNNQST
jgi:hypothetical protein